jgi:type IV secretory pathway VirB3-like protein
LIYPEREKKKTKKKLIIWNRDSVLVLIAAILHAVVRCTCHLIVHVHYCIYIYGGVRVLARSSCTLMVQLHLHFAFRAVVVVHPCVRHLDQQKICRMHACMHAYIWRMTRHI